MRSTPFLILILGFFKGSSLYGKTKCPKNYVPIAKSFKVSNDVTVPELSNDFCVMQYEAKKVSGDKPPVSTPDGDVWVSINREDAEKKCASIGIGYHLMTLPEWQTMAREIENVAENWSGGGRFVGEINQGHVSPFPNTPLSASDQADFDPCHLTGKSCSNGVWSRFRRTHRLSSNNLIWDVSGNVWEWLQYGVGRYEDETELKDLFDQKGKTAKKSPLKDGFAAVSEGVVRKWFGPSHDYKSDQVPTLGSLWLSLDMGADVLVDGQGKSIERSKAGIIRGGSFGSTLDAGIFATNMIIQTVEKQPNVGFRCAYYIEPSEVER